MPTCQLSWQNAILFIGRAPRPQALILLKIAPAARTYGLHLFLFSIVCFYFPYGCYSFTRLRSTPAHKQSMKMQSRLWWQVLSGFRTQSCNVGFKKHGWVIIRYTKKEKNKGIISTWFLWMRETDNWYFTTKQNSILSQPYTLSSISRNGHGHSAVKASFLVWTQTMDWRDKIKSSSMPTFTTTKITAWVECWPSSLKSSFLTIRKGRN